MAIVTSSFVDELAIKVLRLKPTRGKLYVLNEIKPQTDSGLVHKNDFAAYALTSQATGIVKSVKQCTQNAAEMNLRDKNSEKFSSILSAVTTTIMYAINVQRCAQDFIFEGYDLTSRL